MISFPMLLFLVFLVLKLTGFVAWSWWWVTAPVWGQVLIIFLISFVHEFRRLR